MPVIDNYGFPVLTASEAKYLIIENKIFGHKIIVASEPSDKNEAQTYSSLGFNIVGYGNSMGESNFKINGYVRPRKDEIVTKAEECPFFEDMENKKCENCAAKMKCSVKNASVK